MTKKNFLDFIPKHNTRFPFTINASGRAVVKMKNVGLANKIAQILFNKPKHSYIELDDFGTFVWQQIDGTTSVYHIGIKLKEQYGKKAEPLYERLSKYISILRKKSFIVIVNR